jgi:hypothetical protein
MRSVTTYAQIFFVVTFLLARPVFAENDGKCLSKLNILQAQLTEYQHSNRRWVTAWGATWTVATVSQLAVAVSIRDQETRKDLWVGSASAALGLIPTLFIPPEATREISFSGDCENKLSQAEALIKELSLNRSAYNGPIAHVSNVAINLATSLILGLGFGHWGAAAISFGAGIPIGEVMILTYPKFEDGLHNEPKLAVIPTSSGPALALSLDF